VGNDKAGCPSFETHRRAMLLRMRAVWFHPFGVCSKRNGRRIIP
jgi:hypothetical protein